MAARRAFTATGAAVLLGSLWLDWYRVVLPPPPPDVEGQAITLLYVADEGSSTSASAWSVFSVTDVLLALLAAALLAVAVRPVTPWLSRVLAGVAGALIAFRVVVAPYELLEPAVGAFVALTAAIAVAAWPQAVRRLGPARLTAGLGGFALLLSLGLTWFGAAAPTGWATYVPFDIGQSQRLVWLDLAVAVIAVPALLVPLRPAAARFARAVGWLAVVLIVGRIVFPPAGLSPQPAVFVALLAAVIAWAGALLSRWEERRAVA